jgi:MFS family permease
MVSRTKVSSMKRCYSSSLSSSSSFVHDGPTRVFHLIFAIIIGLNFPSACSLLNNPPIRQSSSFYQPPSNSQSQCKLRPARIVWRVYGNNRKSSQSNKPDDDNSQSSTKSSIPQTVATPLTVLLLSQFVLFIGVGAVIPTIPLYGKEIGLSSAANGIVISTPAVALLLLANWGGKQADLGRKPMMIGGMALIVISDIGTALAQSLPTLIVARLGLGAGRALAESGERGMLVDLANQIPTLRGRALAAQQAAVALGIAIGAPAGGVVVERYGPRAAFVCVSVAAMVALIMYCFLPETVTGRNSMAAINDSGTKMKNGTSETPMKGPPTDNDGVWKSLLKQDTWRGLAICQSGASFGFAAKIASIPILAATTLPGGAIGAGALLSAAGLSGLVGAPIGGWSTDRIGAKWTAVISGIVSGTGLILVPLSLNGLPFTLFQSIPQIEFGSVSLPINGFCFSCAVIMWSLGATAQGPALTALAQQNAPRGSEATSLAFVKACGDGTYIAAPFLLGVLADSLSDTAGIECSFAGITTVFGVFALARLVQEPETLIIR